jgi:high affinity Mn2+ porin
MLTLLLTFGLGSMARAQSKETLLPGTERVDSAQPPPAAAGDSADADPTAAPTMFPHPDDTRYFAAGQANIIFQAHGPFHSPYEGTNSLLGRGEYKTSMLGTVYLAYQLARGPKYATDGIFDVEVADGRGISEALGLAGMTDLDVVRNPNLGKVPYLARYELHQVIGLSDTMVEAGRGPFSLATELPQRRIELYAGRFGLPDFLDINSVGTDSHLQFMNWTGDNNGAWDYAANTRGYTDGIVAEYVDRAFTVRYALAAMPTVANGEVLQYELRQASGQNVELELRRGAGVLVKPLARRKAAVRLLGYVNHANMGDYRQQNIKFIEGLTATPEITAHPLQTTVKYGLGLNLEQAVSEDARVYGRFGWNEMS